MKQQGSRRQPKAGAQQATPADTAGCLRFWRGALGALDLGDSIYRREPLAGVLPTFVCAAVLHTVVCTTSFNPVIILTPSMHSNVCLVPCSVHPMHCICCRPTHHKFSMPQLVKYVVCGGRPLLPDRHALPGHDTPSFANLDSYISLMEKCWAQDPKERPSFQEISNMLRCALQPVYLLSL